jgi:hypothetical protein
MRLMFQKLIMLERVQHPPWTTRIYWITGLVISYKPFEIGADQNGIEILSVVRSQSSQEPSRHGLNLKGRCKDF